MSGKPETPATPEAFRAIARRMGITREDIEKMAGLGGEPESPAAILRLEIPPARSAAECRADAKEGNINSWNCVQADGANLTGETEGTE